MRWWSLRAAPDCVLYPCGAAAVANAILSFVGAGDHLLVTGSVYEPTQDFCTHILGRMNVSTTYFDPLIGADIANLIQPNTRVVFLESPVPSPWKCRISRPWCRPFAPWRRTW